MELKMNHSSVWRYICLSFPVPQREPRQATYTHCDRDGDPTTYGTGCANTHTHTLGRPAAVQLDLPLGRSPNQTDKSLTDGSWQRDYHRDRRSVCSCGWWSLQQGSGGWERTLCTFTRLALVSPRTSVFLSRTQSYPSRSAPRPNASDVSL